MPFSNKLRNRLLINCWLARDLYYFCDFLVAFVIFKYLPLSAPSNLMRVFETPSLSLCLKAGNTPALCLRRGVAQPPVLGMRGVLEVGISLWLSRLRVREYQRSGVETGTKGVQDVSVMAHLVHGDAGLLSGSICFPKVGYCKGMIR